MIINKIKSLILLLYKHYIKQYTMCTYILLVL